ncbi:MAG: hypothetical protein IIZ47_01195, partial [Erysipelotrichaceae bacterium]|nr:hypothetical protein [Erysipelotrichaceae bacterium]
MTTSSNAKCRGCGIELQNTDPKKPGYVTKPGQEYCQRCFRLIHYGDLRKLHRNVVDNRTILKMHQDYSSDVVCLIVDIFDALYGDLEELVSSFEGRKMILIFSKSDLLPKDTPADVVEKALTGKVSSIGNAQILDVLFTSIHDSNLRDFLYESLER